MAGTLFQNIFGTFWRIIFGNIAFRNISMQKGPWNIVEIHISAMGLPRNIQETLVCEILQARNIGKIFQARNIAKYHEAQ